MSEYAPFVLLLRAIRDRKVQVETAGIEKLFAYGNILNGVKVLMSGDVNETLQFVSQCNYFRPASRLRLLRRIDFYLFSLENVTLFLFQRLYV
jgi:hypothetical protein